MKTPSLLEMWKKLEREQILARVKKDLEKKRQAKKGGAA